MGEEEHSVDPSGLAIPSKEFFVEVDVPFGTDAGGGLLGAPFDGAVDSFIAELLIDVASVACDPVSAVQLSMSLPRGLEGSAWLSKWLSDAFYGVRVGPWYVQMKSPLCANSFRNLANWA